MGRLDTGGRGGALGAAGTTGAAATVVGAGGGVAGVAATTGAGIGAAAGASATTCAGVSTIAGSAASPFLADAFFFGSGCGSSGCWSRTSPSRSALRRTRSACASTMLDEWLFTPIPSAWHRSSVSLLVSPSSRANSYTRMFAGKSVLSPLVVLRRRPVCSPEVAATPGPEHARPRGRSGPHAFPILARSWPIARSHWPRRGSPFARMHPGGGSATPSRATAICSHAATSAAMASASMSARRPRRNFGTAATRQRCDGPTHTPRPSDGPPTCRVPSALRVMRTNSPAGRAIRHPMQVRIGPTAVPATRLRLRSLPRAPQR